MQYMGTIIWKKSSPWPSSQATYVGLHLDVVSMTATIMQEWWAATGDMLEQCVPDGRVRYAQVKRLSLLSSAHQVVPLGLFYMRRLQLWYRDIHRRFGDKLQFNNRLVLVPLEVQGTPLLQGRPISGLDAHKAKRLAQGFDEHSEEVMLHSCKDSSNASYQGYWGRFYQACAERNLDPYEASYGDSCFR